MEKRKWHITYNAPVTLTFSIICVAALLLNLITKGVSNQLLFMTYRHRLSDPLTWLRLFTHTMGHASWDHLLGNLSLILLLGPLLEEKYGSKRLAIIFAVTAVVTGITNNLLFANAGLLGASGIVFALILLSSITSYRQGEIPLTFILVAAIYLGGQIYSIFFVSDNISNLTHLVGGIVGAILGFIMQQKMQNR